MNVTPAQAYRIGKDNGISAVENCEVAEGETVKQAAYRAEENARQYRGHMPPEVHRDDNLFRQYSDGVDAGIRRATRTDNIRRPF